MCIQLYTHTHTISHFTAWNKERMKSGSQWIYQIVLMYEYATMDPTCDPTQVTQMQISGPIMVRATRQLEMRGRPKMWLSPRARPRPRKGEGDNGFSLR